MNTKMTDGRSFAATEPSPTVAPPQSPGLTPVLERNIYALQRRRKAEELRASTEQHIADAITRFTGSMAFVYIHLVIFGFWIVANLGWIPSIPKWDQSFVVLGMVASVEAIFLSTFVLISQNRMASAAEKHADLDLQINLLAEHEVTKLVTLTSAMAKQMGVSTHVDREVDELARDVAPEQVLDEIEGSRADSQQESFAFGSGAKSRDN